MSADGYLCLRGLLPRDAVLAARGTVLGHMAACEGLEPGTRVLDGVMGQTGRSVPMMGRRAVTHDPVVRRVLEAPELFTLFESLFGGPAMTLDYKWLRAVGVEQCTGAHMDYVYMGRGSARLHTAWVPLGDVPIEQGTLVVAHRSHASEGFERVRETYGRSDVEDTNTFGWFSEDPVEVHEKFGGRWLTGDVAAGDVIVFGMHLMHMSTTNTTDRWRLSCDVRFQPASDPPDARWMGVDPPGAAIRLGDDPIGPLRDAWGVG